MRHDFAPISFYAAFLRFRRSAHLRILSSVSAAHFMCTHICFLEDSSKQNGGASQMVSMSDKFTKVTALGLVLRMSGFIYKDSDAT